MCKTERRSLSAVLFAGFFYKPVYEKRQLIYYEQHHKDDYHFYYRLHRVPEKKILNTAENRQQLAFFGRKASDKIYLVDLVISVPLGNSTSTERAGTTDI